MPITPNYTWKETESMLTVEVELKGVARSSVNVSATGNPCPAALPPSSPR